ncbi:protein of unknown function [Nitrospina watsonii]|uniref:Uncharacterized protein n=1 Tax=Nitrospina watsonii TaxID=1323948 RepID=A0ABN8W3F5_9BACT|nr:protein of unknown function [Nitrospina watsonii]
MLTGLIWLGVRPSFRFIEFSVGMGNWDGTEKIEVVKYQEFRILATFPPYRGPASEKNH